MSNRINRSNIEVVLVEPQNAGNVGAAAPALYNMGLDRLSLVAWKEDVESRRTAFEWATDGEPVLKKARRCQSLEEAVADCGLAVATSARQGSDRPPDVDRTEFVALLRRWTPGNRVAVVFGPERTGLRTEHVRLCSHTLMLPTAPGCTSLNLAQAVLLVGYEVLLASDVGQVANLSGAEMKEGGQVGNLSHVATRAERHRLYAHAVEVLEASGFLRPGRPIRPLQEICYLLDRAAATTHEVRILHGMCRRILWAVRKGEE